MLSHKAAIFGLLGMLLASYATASYSADRLYISKNPANTSIAIFVHGFRGEYVVTWGKLPELLQKDPALDSYDFLFWGYPSAFFGANEKIGTTGQHLKTEIDYLPKNYDRVILIGHSMGGLVIRSYIVQALLDGKGNDLKNIVYVILFGTPNEGLGRAEAIPKIVNDQIADLGLASELIVTLRKYWVQRVTNAPRHDEYNRQIPTLAVAGYTDNFVPKESVNSFFLETATTDGDHISMVKPENTEHLTYRIIKSRLLHALGTKSRQACNDPNQPTTARDTNRSDKPDTYYTQGLSYLQGKDYDCAIAEFDKAIRLAATEKSYYHRGLAHYYNDDFDKAITDWNQTINLNPNNTYAYRQRGNAFVAKKDYRRAIDDYNRAIELEPEVAVAYYNRGLVYKDIGDKEKAIADFRKVLKLYNDSGTEQAAKKQLEVLGER